MSRLVRTEQSLEAKRGFELFWISFAYEVRCMLYNLPVYPHKDSGRVCESEGALHCRCWQRACLEPYLLPPYAPGCAYQRLYGAVGHPRR